MEPPPELAERGVARESWDIAVRELSRLWDRVRRCACGWLSLLLFAPAAMPQERFWIDAPGDLADPAHENNLIPLGGLRTGGGVLSAETRWQQLVHARCMPPLRCRLEAMSVLCEMGAVEQVYQNLRIDVAASRAEGLELDLEANLRVPMTVLSPKEHTVRWLAGEPTRIDFETAFPHDGVSGLVLDIYKTIDPQALPANVLNMRVTKHDPAAAAQPPAAVYTAAQDAIVRGHPCQLLVRFHFATRERFGARLVMERGKERPPAAIPEWAQVRRGAKRAAPAPGPAHEILVAEAGAVGHAGAWRVFRFALQAGSRPGGSQAFGDDSAAAHVWVRIGPGGLGRAALPLPTIRELLGTTLAACSSLDGTEGGWDRDTTLRIDR